MTLHTYTIMPLDTAHLPEICDDIQQQYESGIAQCALFMMKLVPEGDPPVDKAAVLCRQYRPFAEELRARGIPCGVLVQASIGHGWKLSEPFPYQRFTGLSNGVESEVVCPYDPGFGEYIYQAFRTIAQCAPDCIMVDDDLRLLGRWTNGCGCPLHLRRFNELAGTSLRREELYAHLTAGDDPAHTQIYLETQKEALLQAATRMRAGIDSVDPTIPGLYCCVGNNAECAYEIAACLAGQGNPVVVRVNNGNYKAEGARYLSDAFQRAAAQIAKLRGKVDILLAETDTCPQNRYSTGAMQLHAHYTGTLLEGAQGAKQWITRLSAWEPGSGKAYRAILARYSRFYAALAEVVPGLRWRGCRIPVRRTPGYVFGRPDGVIEEDAPSGWCRCVLERLGLPVYFSPEPGGVLALEGRTFLTDEEVQEAAARTMLLASDTAKELEERGLLSCTGVHVEPWDGKVASVERYAGNSMPTPYHLQRLVPVRTGVAALSTLCHSVDGVHFTELAPGVTAYPTPQGGTTYVFAGTPRAPYTLTDGFSFLNETRKRQLVRILREAGELPVWCPTDEEIYLRAADAPGGTLFCAVFHLGLDPIESLTLACDRPVTRIQQLMPDGTRADIAFTKEGETLHLATPCRTLEPVILWLS